MKDSLHITHDTPQVAQPQRRSFNRRDSLKLLGAISASLSLPLLSGCEQIFVSAAKLTGRWPDLKLEPITGEGYGTDPNLTRPADAPWPLTMTAEQRQLTSVIADILIPREGDNPSASEIKVVDALDEWVSAPYPSFQSDRVEILSALVWLDEESARRFERKFVHASRQEQLAIIDDIAYKEAESNPRFAYMARVFDAMRTLFTTAYFCSPEGTRELGYQGNTPIAGDYPGPTEEAMAHLEKILGELDLQEYAYHSPGS